MLVVKVRALHPLEGFSFSFATWGDLYRLGAKWQAVIEPT